MANPKILEEKQKVIDEITNNVKESSSFIFLENNGLTVSEMMELRRKLKESDSTLKIYKNTLVARALDTLNIIVNATIKIIMKTTAKGIRAILDIFPK